MNMNGNTYTCRNTHFGVSQQLGDSPYQWTHEGTTDPYWVDPRVSGVTNTIQHYTYVDSLDTDTGQFVLALMVLRSRDRSAYDQCLRNMTAEDKADETIKDVTSLLSMELDSVKKCMRLVKKLTGEDKIAQYSLRILKDMQEMNITVPNKFPLINISPTNSPILHNDYTWAADTVYGNEIPTIRYTS